MLEEYRNKIGGEVVRAFVDRVTSAYAIIREYMGSAEILEAGLCPVRAHKSINMESSEELPLGVDTGRDPDQFSDLVLKLVQSKGDENERKSALLRLADFMGLR